MKCFSYQQNVFMSQVISSETLYHQPLFDNLNYTNIKLILHEENIRNIWRLSISVVIQDCNGQTIIVLYNKLSSSEEMIIVNICIEAVFAIFTRSNCKYDEEKLLSSLYICFPSNIFHAMLLHARTLHQHRSLSNGSYVLISLY